MTSQNNIEYRLGVLSRVGVQIPDGFGGQRPIRADDLFKQDEPIASDPEADNTEKLDHIELGMSAHVKGTLKITKFMNDISWSIDDMIVVGESHSFDPNECKYIKKSIGHGFLGLMSNIPTDLTEISNDPWLVIHIEDPMGGARIFEIAKDRKSAMSRAAEVNTMFGHLNKFMCVRLRDLCPAWVENMDEAS